MRRLLLMPGLALLLAGCSGSEAARSNAGVAATPVPTVAAPQLLRGGKLGIIPRKSESEDLSVGDSQDRVDRLFPVPKSSYPVRGLPPGFQPPYRADGFETPTIGFGVIYYEGVVAQAMYRELGITQADVMTTVSDYTDVFGPPTDSIPGTKVSYWFWADQKNSQRLMICAVGEIKDAKRWDLTTAVGEDILMDPLRMSPTAAKEDRQALEKVSPRIEHPG